MKFTIKGDFPDLEREFDQWFDEKKTEATFNAEATLPALKEHIHKETGALADTARLNIGTTPNVWRAEFIVGRSPEVDYVLYENARQGHAIWGELDEAVERDMSAIWGGPPSSEHGSVDHSKREAL